MNCHSSAKFVVPRHSQWAPNWPANKFVMLPPIRSAVYNGVGGGRILEIPSTLDLQRWNVKAQAQLQTQQIDSAIQLLKMQYDAIMSSVQKNGQSDSGDASQSSRGNSSVALDQTSFAAQFELPFAAGCDVRSSLSVETRISNKRATCDCESVDPNKSANSEFCHENKTPDTAMHTNKRRRS